MDIINDAQVIANDYLIEIDHPSGTKVKVAAAPVKFDEKPPVLRAAPEVGADTESVPFELGLDWDDLIRYKDLGAIT